MKQNGNNLPDTGWKTLVTRTLSELGERIDELSENVHEEIENMSETEK